MVPLLMFEYYDRKIEDEITALVDEKKLCSGLTLIFGGETECYSYNRGITGNNNVCVSSDTIIDLASVTKLFLSLAYFYLYDSGAVDFDKPVSYYSAEFKNIKDFTLRDLMHFNCVLKTQRRITDITYKQAVDEIAGIDGEISTAPLYSDMPPIVLGALFKDISRMSFGEFVDRYIIKQLGLKNTFWRTERIYENYMDYSGELQIFNGKVYKLDNPPLTVNDVKARILSDDGKNLCGHAGIFSSANDMCRISQALLAGKIISAESLNKIGEVINTASEQRFGSLCYCKSPNAHLSEINADLSDNAFAMSGFTGSYYCIDPQKKLFIFIGANKLSNRVSKCDNSIVIDNSLINIGDKYVLCSKDYVYQKDNLRDACIARLLT